MATYMIQIGYTPESIARQVKNPSDRIETAAKPLIEAVGGRILAGGYTFGDYDVAIIFEAPDDESVAAAVLTAVGGGALGRSKTTKLLDGSQWIAALTKAGTLVSQYAPPR